MEVTTFFFFFLGSKEVYQHDPLEEKLSRPASPQPQQPSNLSSSSIFLQYPELLRPPSPISCLEFPEEQEADCDDEEEEEDGEEEEFMEPTGLDYTDVPHRPVYLGAPITLHESLVSILTLALTFSLSQECIKAILNLVYLHCRKEGNIFRKSMYFFKKYFAYIRGDVDYEYYCSKCFKRTTKEGCENCKEGGKSPKLCYIIKLSLIEQIKTMMKRKGFYSKLQLGRGRQDSNGELRDLKDGALYKLHEELGLLDESSLTFNWYTDGAALFKSSKMSVWPLYLTINELPFSERFCKENIIVPVLWCGPVKPHGNMLLHCLEPGLNELRKGVSMEVDSIGTKVVKGVLIGGTGDTPARALMLHMVQHNGENSCQKCYQPGECREGHFGVRVFPYAPKEMTPRNAENAKSDSNYARLTKSDAYMGFKGITALSKLTLDPIRGTALDVMHLIYGGVCKINLKFFTDDKYSKLNCNLSKVKRDKLNERLIGIKPPHYVTRVTKSVDDIAIWKTSEFKSLTLYYLPVILIGLIPRIHLLHFNTLVAAVQLLNAENVTSAMQEKAGKLLHKYVAYFEDLYDRAYMTLSIHLLLHLMDLVKDCGPLWVTSCFPLESINGIIMKLVHGTRYAELQIASSLNTCLGLPDLVTNLGDGEISTFCKDLLTRTKKCDGLKVGTTLVIGKQEKVNKFPTSLQECFKKLDLVEADVVSFQSLRKNRCLYVVESHLTARDSSGVTYTENGETKVGIVTNFFLPAVCPCLNRETCKCLIYAGITKLEKTTSFPTLVPDIDIPNTHGYHKLNEFCLITVDMLKDVCVKMIVDGKLYIAQRCNQKETE